MLDIEDRLTLDERSALDFVLSMRRRWSDTLYPALVAGVATPEASTHEVEELLHAHRLYPWFSHLERIQQKMLWRVAGDAVLRNRDSLTATLNEGSARFADRLELNPSLDLPAWYTDFDIHLQPGSFFSDDLSGFVYELGARIVMLRDNDGYRFHTLFAETVLPDRPDADLVIDLGCGFGKSTRPLTKRYPSAKILGVDLAAPGLRLACSEAGALGLDIHYRQASAQDTGERDESADVVTGTMLLHEMPSAAIVETIEEAARLLKPGGEAHFLEFMLTGDPLRDATIIEHAERNNEPYFRDLFATDVLAACAAAGLVDARWTPFDERITGLSPEGWGTRPEWHFPWGVLSARKPSA